ncbi:MAG: acyltransferase family protein [Gammaproteobacteria bacterium]|nr:acyltransferase family protein [Gammaproteobacteria bacterium]
MQVTAIDERTSAVLDVIRWLAALAVVLTHLNDQLFLSLQQTPAENHTLAFMAWKFISASGNEAVIVFFVISGYLVGGAALAEFLKNGDLQLSRYLLRRGARLYTVLVPALVIGAALDIIGSQLSGGSSVYAATLHHLSVTGFLGNLVFMQTLFVETFGSNDALWSLTNEFFYYLMCGLTFYALSKNRSLLQRSTLLLLLGGIAWLIFPKILLFGTLWLLGMAIRVMPLRRTLPLPVAVCQFLVVLVAIRLFFEWQWHAQLLAHYAVSALAALSFALLVASLQARPTQAMPALVRHPFNKFAADFSYTLYATHFPFIMFVIAASETLFGWGWHSSYSGDRELGLALLLVLATMVYAWLMYLAFEANTRQVYEWLKRGQQRLQDMLRRRLQQKGSALGQVNEI